MGSPAFTAGPWYAEQHSTVFVIETATKSIANVGRQGSAGRDGTAEANARLIAAAPELYAKAEHLLDMIDAQERVYTPKPTRESEDDANSRDEGDQVFGNAVEALRASLAKARGEQVAK